MRIGVVIPVYNRATLVLECLESIAAQSRAPDAVVVVDDCSTDATPDGVQRWMDGREDGIDWRLMRQDENGGQAPARNRAVRALDDCDSIAFLDSDDLWPPDYLERVEHALASRPDAVATVADNLNERADRRGPPVLRDQRELLENPMRNFVRRGAPTPSSVAVRRAALLAVGGFEESLRFGEDLACYLQLLREGTWIHVPGAPIRYRVGVSTQRKEAAALCETFHSIDTSIAIARRVEKFCRESDPPGARRLIALAWYRASSNAAQAGDWAVCRRICWQVLRHQPWHGRAAWRWIRAAACGVLGVPGKAGAAKPTSAPAKG